MPIHELRDRARGLRRDQTEAEAALWRRVRGNRVGVKFRRQAPIGSYVVDFCCYAKKLIVELDGSQHERQVDYDEARTRFLQREGFEVLRFWNDDVLKNIDGVLQAIGERLKDRAVE